MKIKPEDRQYMELKLTAFVSANYGDCERHYYRVPITQFSWDIARAVGLMPFITDTLYKYANDSHITTVLRLIARSFNFEQMED